MKLGFVTAIFHDLPLEEVVGFAADAGYDCIEVMCWPPGGANRKYAGVSHIDVTTLDDARCREIHSLCTDRGVSISGLGYYPNILSHDPEEGAAAKEHLHRVIEATARLGLRNCNTFIGADHTQPIDVNLARFREVFPEIVAAAEQHDVLLGIENCPMLFSGDEWPSGKNLARGPAIWRQMFEAIPSKHFGLNYDPSHMVMQQMDCIAPIREFADRIFHLHAKDMRIDRERLNELGVLALNPGWSTPKIPGLGDVNWNQFISVLTDVGYDGAICVEVEDDAFTGTLEGRKRSLEISRNVLRPLIG